MDHHSGHHMSTQATTGSPIDMSHTHGNQMVGSVGHDMGHSGHTIPQGHQMMDMMKMYFHFDLSDTLLIHSWKINSVGLMVVACLLLFTLAYLYEGLKCYREYLLRQHLTLRRAYPVAVIGAGSDRNPMPVEEAFVANGMTLNVPGVTHRRPERKVLNWTHVVQSLLHMLQVAVSYTLMLAVMTFNGYLILSVILGAGVGYLSFCWRRLMVIDVTEHCH